jgi:predicted amidohydrolase YtcJ
MRLIFTTFLVLLHCLPLQPATAQRNREPAPPTQDFALIRGLVIAGSPKYDGASAFFVQNGRFTAVGEDAEILALTSPETHIIDAEGKLILPGFIDGHTHLMMGKNLLLGVNLTGLASKSEWLELIKHKVANLPEEAWLIGGNWDHTLGDGILPTKEELDSVTGDHPAILWDIDHHSAWANTAALRAANINAETIPPPGGKIELNAQGQPSGILLEGAGFLVEASMPKESEERQKQGLLAAMKVANSHGITTVHDMSGFPSEQNINLSFAELAATGRSTVRVWEGLLLPTDPGDLVAAAQNRDHYKKRLRETNIELKKGPLFELGYVKYVMDGVLSTRTALLSETYSDVPTNTSPFMSIEALSQLTRQANEAGFSVATHAVGDAAVSRVLDAYAKAGTKPTNPNRIEHIELINAKDIPRLEALNVVASMQPYHLACCGEKYVRARVGADRIHQSYRWKTLLHHNVDLVLGSDWPTSPFSPIEQINAATERNSSDQKSPTPYWPYAEEALTLSDAIYAYTSANAAITDWGGDIGSIEPVKWADFVILDGATANEPLTSLEQVRVFATYLAGDRVYQRASSVDAPLKN